MKNRKEKINIVEKDIYTLKVAEYNPRTLSKKQYADLRNSLKKFGFTVPCIINTFEGRENVIVGGHQRVKIWEEMGYSTAPCIEVCLSEQEERELNIRLNRNHAEWDFDKLANEFEFDDLIDYGFEREQLLQEDKKDSDTDKLVSFSVKMKKSNKERITNFLLSIEQQYDCESREEALLIVIDKLIDNKEGKIQGSSTMKF